MGAANVTRADKSVANAVMVGAAGVSGFGFGLTGAFGGSGASVTIGRRKFVGAIDGRVRGKVAGGSSF